MTAIRKEAHVPLSQIAYVEDLNGLENILRPDCAAVIQRNSKKRPFLDWLATSDVKTLPKARLPVHLNDIAKTLGALCDEAGMLNCPERQLWIKDIVGLSCVFSKIMETPYLKVRLDVVDTNACKKFHVDFLTARLVCTYRGSGTEYGFVTDGAEPAEIMTVPTGDPLLMRGENWPETPRSGFRHRSPQIEGTGETRLVLVLDPADMEDVACD